MNILDYIVDKYQLDLNTGSPIEIPHMGRNSLANWFRELEFQVGVEIGVAEGRYSKVICQANPQMKVYGVDPYQPYKGSTDYVQDNEFDGIYQQAQKRLRQFPNYVLIKEFSLQALRKFADHSLDFVYIDANHKEPHVTQDIEGWSQKVKTGGIVSGHDYIEERGVKIKTGKLMISDNYYRYILQEELPHKWQVKDAVNAYTRKNHIKPWFILDLKTDENPTWMWVKT